ncbi:hypothetical protein [Ferrigenium kumadai]|uniref:hypothetical protein n=1 Tax=Ferrigenium kumadai TaxID=1682490 RepID=UPI001BB320BC|nr:hypothetical protein [Ferrigenium kumadai]
MDLRTPPGNPAAQAAVFISPPKPFHLQCLIQQAFQQMAWFVLNKQAPSRGMSIKTDRDAYGN